MHAPDFNAFVPWGVPGVIIFHSKVQGLDKNKDPLLNGSNMYQVMVLRIMQSHVWLLDNYYWKKIERGRKNFEYIIISM